MSPLRNGCAAAVLRICCLAALIACQPAQQDDGAVADTGITGSAPAATPTSPCTAAEPAASPDAQTVAVYFACTEGTPGQLYPTRRRIPADAEPVQAAVRELLRGPTDAERAAGLRSLFSSATADMVRSVTRSAAGDTVSIDFADFRSALGDSENPASFLPGGVMADVTWTLFRQFPEVRVLRFSFDGSEDAFWSWVSGDDAAPRAFTRDDWERV